MAVVRLAIFSFVILLYTTFVIPIAKPQPDYSSCPSIPSISESISTVPPALYVFGDSTVDAGNNNFISNSPRANFLPFGIDFKSTTPTGRFTNGKTIADYIALVYNLPLAPAYLGLNPEQKKITKTGINYASAGCGILSDTKPNMLNCSSFKDQVMAFNQTVQQDIPSMFEDPIELKDYLANSIFFISAGSNDFFLNFKGDVHSFTTSLLDQLEDSLMMMYNIGARKFLVNNIGPIGCLPSMIYATGTGQCNETLNSNILPYNAALPVRLQYIKDNYPDANLNVSNSFDLLQHILARPADYGFTYAEEPCCGYLDLGRYGCPPNSIPCSDRDIYLFFDTSHTTQQANCIFVEKLFA